MKNFLFNNLEKVNLRTIRNLRLFVMATIGYIPIYSTLSIYLQIFIKFLWILTYVLWDELEKRDDKNYTFYELLKNVCQSKKRMIVATTTIILMVSTTICCLF